jgi:hypothetical protein
LGFNVLATILCAVVAALALQRPWLETYRWGRVLVKTLDAIFAAAIGLAILAVIVSKGSASSTFVTTGFNALTQAVTALMAPLKAKQN